MELTETAKTLIARL